MLDSLIDERAEDHVAAWRTRVRQQMLTKVRYSEDDAADLLQQQLQPWLEILAASPKRLETVTNALRGSAPALQEALHWAFSYEVSSGYMALANGASVAELHAAFVPFVCTGSERLAPDSASPFAGMLARQTMQSGLVHADELLLVAPFFLPAEVLTRLPALTALLRETWTVVAQAWGPGLRPSLQARAHWEAQWASRPTLRQWHAPPFGPGDLRFAMLVVASPELRPELEVPLQPWQRLEREQMRLRTRFTPETHHLQGCAAEDLEAASQARVDWAEGLLEALDELNYPAMPGSDPRDAYSALALAATNSAADQVGEVENGAALTEPIMLLVDAAGVSVELAGQGRSLPWAPQGALMPGMLRALAIRLNRAVGREVNLSIALEPEGWALIQ